MPVNGRLGNASILNSTAWPTETLGTSTSLRLISTRNEPGSEIGSRGRGASDLFADVRHK